MFVVLPLPLGCHHCDYINIRSRPARGRVCHWCHSKRIDDACDHLPSETNRTLSVEVRGFADEEDKAERLQG